jgi:hypothetical protein
MLLPLTVAELVSVSNARFCRVARLGKIDCGNAASAPSLALTAVITFRPLFLIKMNLKRRVKPTTVRPFVNDRPIQL